MSAREGAEPLGISRRTVCKRLARYQAGGEADLHHRSSRPHRCPRRLPVETVAAIAAMRRMRMTSPAIAFTLCQPLSSVGLGLRRLCSNRRSPLETKPPVVRYEHKRPGDMIHQDINELSRIGGVGHRIAGDRSPRQTSAGWEYLHASVVDNSRLAYRELPPDEKATSAACFMIRAVGWFERPGVKVQRVMTDNGGCYLWHLLQTAVKSLGARHAM